MQENFNSAKIKLIIGLGNPEKVYENTYHNAGALFVDRLKTTALFHKPDQILKSGVFMNESGNFVKKETKKRNLPPSALLVAQDDSDITLGTYKMSFDSGAAGHKGTASIIKALETQKFWRLRIGIRPKSGKKRVKAEEFVLKQISAGDKKELAAVFEEATQVLLL